MRIPVLDLVPDLQKDAQSFPNYYQTDSHWNEWGAFVAGQRLFGQLHALNHRIPILKPSDYKINIVETPGLDLATSMGLPDFFRERKPELVPTASVPSYVKTNILNVHEFTTVCKTCANLKVLMVRDSYGMGLEPLLSARFREVTYVWTNVISFEQIEKIHPDIVMFEFVERKLMGLPPYEVPE
jgi:alginate O-acetyltransferase complex protein AlgJ